MRKSTFILSNKLNVRCLGACCAFSSSVRLAPKTVVKHGMAIRSGFNGSTGIGLAIGRGRFGSIDFSMKIRAGGVLMFSTPRGRGPLVFKAIFKAKATSVGKGKRLVGFSVGVQDSPGASIGLSFVGGSSTTRCSFVAFIGGGRLQRVTLAGPISSVGPLVFGGRSRKTRLHVGFLLSVAPSTSVRLVVSPITNSGVANGYGKDLRVRCKAGASLHVCKGVKVMRKGCGFDLRRLVRGGFGVQSNDVVGFQKSPFRTAVGMGTVCGMATGVRSLSPDLACRDSQHGAPIGYMLGLSNILEGPAVSFSLRLPDSGRRLRQRIGDLISARSVVAQRVVCLLILGGFCAPRCGTRCGSGSFDTITSSTLSSRVSDVVGDFASGIRLNAGVQADRSNVRSARMRVLLSDRLLGGHLVFGKGFKCGGDAVGGRGGTFVNRFSLRCLLAPDNSVHLGTCGRTGSVCVVLGRTLAARNMNVVCGGSFAHFSSVFQQQGGCPLVPLHPAMPSDARRAPMAARRVPATARRAGGWSKFRVCREENRISVGRS